MSNVESAIETIRISKKQPNALEDNALSNDEEEVNKKEIAGIATVIFIVVEAIAKIIAPNFLNNSN